MDETDFLDGLMPVGAPNFIFLHIRCHYVRRVGRVALNRHSAVRHTTEWHKQVLVNSETRGARENRCPGFSSFCEKLYVALKDADALQGLKTSPRGSLVLPRGHLSRLGGRPQHVCKGWVQSCDVRSAACNERWCPGNSICRCN